jgi:hypothetical protein
MIVQTRAINRFRTLRFFRQEDGMARIVLPDEFADHVRRHVLTRRDALAGAAKITLGGALGLAAVTRLAPTAFAQATPAALDLSAYPEVKVTNTDSAVTLSPDTVPAGLVLLTVINQMTPSENGGGGSSVVGPPAGMSMADFAATLGEQLATPEAFPALAYTATLVGGPGNIDPGQTGQAIVNIPAGQWGVTGIGNQPLAMLTATAGSPSAAAEPVAAVTITEIDFSFAGFDHVPAGPQIWKVVHKGTQPHMLLLLSVPAATTIDQVMALVSAPPNATPVPGGLDFSTIKDAGGVDIQSAGSTVWPVLNLAAGRYAALCFVGDPNKGGEPHAMEGMSCVFDAGA